VSTLSRNRSPRISKTRCVAMLGPTNWLDAHLCARRQSARLVKSSVHAWSVNGSRRSRSGVMISLPDGRPDRSVPVQLAGERCRGRLSNCPPVPHRVASRFDPVRWVLVRDPQSTFATQALRCLITKSHPLQILSWVVLRPADGDHLPCAGAHSGGETGAPVVAAGDCSHDARVARPLFLRHAPRTRLPAGAPSSGPIHGLVS
jgi:hypothetical protein